MPAISHRRILLVLALAGLFAVTRLPTMFFTPLSNDECTHSAVAVRCSHVGELPYVGATSNKGPLQYWAYQGLFWLAGDYNLLAAHLAGAVIVALNTLLVWRIASACFGPCSGPLAGVIYLVVMACQQVFFSFNAALPASLPLLAANWLVLRAGRPLSPARCLTVGVLVMVAAGFRQNCLIAYPIACGGVLALSLHSDGRIWAALGRGVLVGVGGLVPVAVVLAVYAWHDALGELYFGYFGYNTAYYLSAVPFTVARILRALRDLSGWLDDTSLITLLALMGLVPIIWKVAVSGGVRQDCPGFFVPRPRGWYLAIVTAALWYGTTVGWRFYHHYRMIELPFTAVLAAGGWLLLLGQMRHRQARLAFAVAGTVALAALLLRGDSWNYLSATLGRGHAPISVADHVSQVALRLKSATTPQDSLFVWGQQPQIYLLAERRMATRFPHCAPLIGLVHSENYAPEDQDRSAWVLPGSVNQMMEDLRADPPAYFVDASQDANFLKGRYPVETYPQLCQWLRANYVYEFELAGADSSVLVVYCQRERRPPAEGAGQKQMAPNG